VAPAPVSDLRFDALEPSSGEALVERRAACFGECAGFVDVPVFARDRLSAGIAAIAGPALIEEAESTAVIGPSASVTADSHGNLIMRLRSTPVFAPGEGLVESRP